MHTHTRAHTHTCMSVHMRRSEDSLGEPVLSSHYVGLTDTTQARRLERHPCTAFSLTAPTLLLRLRLTLAWDSLMKRSWLAEAPHLTSPELCAHTSVLRFLTVGSRNQPEVLVAAQ